MSKIGVTIVDQPDSLRPEYHSPNGHQKGQRLGGYDFFNHWVSSGPMRESYCSLASGDLNLRAERQNQRFARYEFRGATTFPTPVLRDMSPESLTTEFRVPPFAKTSWVGNGECGGRRGPAVDIPATQQTARERKCGSCGLPN